MTTLRVEGVAFLLLMLVEGRVLSSLPGLLGKHTRDCGHRRRRGGFEVDRRLGARDNDRRSEQVL
jgi:hypothetical protein